MIIVDSSETLGRRDRKKLETRAALERAALTLVAERGLAGVTVEDIAAAVDVSSRTFFNYFPSKEDALLGTHPTAGTELRERLAAVPAGVPSLEVLRLVLREEAERIQERREQWLLRLSVFERNPSLLPRLIAGGAETEHIVRTFLAERIGTGPAADGHAQLVAAVALAAYRAAVLRWSVAHGDPALPDVVDDVFSRLTAGLPDPGPLPA
ncbi:AcrR family transcriptional regulator [Streptosporangium becharense]|uniref:AcrR family transcriptional regulator n=1 Tax=Streptosporangium becharense TaxID=1816182 RepID=A0A7W9MJH2_9ACTN|nr:TetR family transcriptional regulator [Streptosporangium becharense]MBB2910302.1 AcrR family transcriptional regulator [Streptosporangium becharense]MBB5823045.1 AcrR family transcriptional regulator [Streptosporangium becharense]